MKIYEYGEQEAPVVLLLDNTEKFSYGEHCENFHIVHVCPEKFDSDNEAKEIREFISSHYNGKVFALTSVAREWLMAQKLLNSGICCDHIIIEGSQETPRHLIWESLKETAQCCTAR